jgi:hypothetical protein
MDGYVLVAVEGCLMAEVVYDAEPADAIRMAERLWPEMDHKSDDFKVFDLEEHIVWKPPQE